MGNESKKVQLVLAHYKEPLDWIEDLQQHCVVYDKGDTPGIVYEFDHVIKLRNFGREGDTYLTHIIDNYPDFSDYTIYSQANIDDHVKDIGTFKQIIVDLVEGKCEPPPRYTGLNTLAVSQGWGSVKNFEDISHDGLPLEEIYDLVYDAEPPSEWRVNYCGIFMVSREALLFHSKLFYEKLYDYMQHHEPLSGYAFERCYCLWFDYDIKGRPDIENAPTSERKIRPQEEIVPSPEEKKRKQEAEHTRNLIYFVVWGAPDNVRMLEFSIATLCMTNDLNKQKTDVLVMCDVDYVRHVNDALPWVKVHITDKNPNGVRASLRKTEIFDYENIQAYGKILYLDCDIVVRGDISSVFQHLVDPDILYVKTESSDILVHRENCFTVRQYTDYELEEFRAKEQYVFNCGQFAFLNSRQNQRHFRNVRLLVDAHKGDTIYEQPYMNTYFNTNFKTSKHPLSEITNLLRTDKLDDVSILALEKEWSIRKERIVHFVNCDQHYHENLDNMKCFFHYIYSRRLRILTHDSRYDIKSIISLPESPTIAEIGSFKGDFSRFLLGFEPQMLFLVDPYRGEILSAETGQSYDGNTLYQTIRKRYANVDNVTLLRSCSSNLEIFDDDTFDMIYIDGDSSIEGVKTDLHLSYQKIKHGGWLCGNNLMINQAKGGSGVDNGTKQAMTEFCKDKGLSVHSIFMDRSVSFAIKVYKVKSYRTT